MAAGSAFNPPPVAAIDFLTRTHRISGRVNIRTRPVGEVLNDASAFVSLEAAYATPLNRAAEVGASFLETALRKTAICVVVQAERDEPLARVGTSVLGRTLQPVSLSIGGFDVQGKMWMGSQPDPMGLIVGGLDRFLAIFDGTVRLALLPDVLFQGELLLVNRDLIDFLGL